MKTAAELFPYLPNENNDTAIREWNQRMCDKREAYNLALSLHEPLMEVEDKIPPSMKLILNYHLQRYSKYVMSHFKGIQWAMGDPSQMIADYYTSLTQLIKDKQ